MYSLLERIIQQFGEENKHLAVKERNNSGVAAWFVSNCNTYSGREKFVDNLKKYISVDIYGHSSCSDLQCDEDCMGMINRTYKVHGLVIINHNSSAQSSII